MVSWSGPDWKWHLLLGKPGGGDSVAGGFRGRAPGLRQGCSGLKSHVKAAITCRLRKVQPCFSHMPLLPPRSPPSAHGAESVEMLQVKKKKKGEEDKAPLGLSDPVAAGVPAPPGRPRAVVPAVRRPGGELLKQTLDPRRWLRPRLCTNPPSSVLPASPRAGSTTAQQTDCHARCSEQAAGRDIKSPASSQGRALRRRLRGADRRPSTRLRLGESAPSPGWSPADFGGISESPLSGGRSACLGTPRVSGQRAVRRKVSVSPQGQGDSRDPPCAGPGRAAGRACGRLPSPPRLLLLPWEGT